MVRAPAAGRVTFAGSVAGMRTLTIEPVPGFKVSLSYLDEVLVSVGARVTRGAVVARAGAPHGTPGVHMSTRIDGVYVDPASQLGCQDTDITRALRLVTPPRPYPRRRAYWNPGRDVRPNSRGPSARGREHPPSAGPRSGPDHPGRGPVAKIRARGD
jgi:murein DD-endopeptidase MepM/ murein hydrolase activator NlpD